MLEVVCSGMPREVKHFPLSVTRHQTNFSQIGYQHGKCAKKQIEGSLAFYAEYFLRKAKMNWHTAAANAQKFLPMLARDWPDLVEEMQGVLNAADIYCSVK